MKCPMPCRCLFGTVPSFGPLLLRLGLAAAILPHGLQKISTLFGGFGFAHTVGMFTHDMHIPLLLAYLAIAVEVLAPIALILGFFTRLAGLALGVHMIVAAILGGHVANGFFMNWFGKQAGEGFEYHILAVAIAFGLFFLGGGRCSLDRCFACHCKCEGEGKSSGGCCCKGGDDKDFPAPPPQA